MENRVYFSDDSTLSVNALETSLFSWNNIENARSYYKLCIEIFCEQELFKQNFGLESFQDFPFQNHKELSFPT